MSNNHHRYQRTPEDVHGRCKQVRQGKTQGRSHHALASGRRGQAAESGRKYLSSGAAQVSRSPALLRAGCRPRAEQQERSAYRVAPVPFVPYPLLKGLHADLLGGGHSGTHDQRHEGTHVLHLEGKADLIAVCNVRLDSDHPQRAQPRLLDNGPQSRAKPGDPGLGQCFEYPGRDLGPKRSSRAATASSRNPLLSARPGRQGAAPWPVAAAPRPGRESHQDPPLDDRVERSARCRVVNVALYKLHLGQAALLGPQPSTGQPLSRAVDADHRAIGPTRSAATNVTSPGPQPKSSTRMPGRMPASTKIIRVAGASTRALGLQAGDLVFTDARTELVTRVVVTHRVSSRQA